MHPPLRGRSDSRVSLIVVGPPPPSWAITPADARVYELADGLWSLRLPLPWNGIPYVNAHVVTLDEGGVMLVDCGGAGHPTATQALEAALGRAGWEVSDVRVLVGTHTHSDHVGIADWIVRRSGAAFWMHPGTAHFYDAMRRPQEIRAARARRARDEGVPDALLDAFADVREETEGMLAPREADHALVDGVRLKSTLGEWEVIETPGHAPSHVGLVQREHGLLIAGDLLSYAFAPYYDYGYSSDPIADYLASLDAVEALGPLRLAMPGHGRPLDDVAGALALYRAGIVQRLDRTRAALAQGPAGAYEITRRMFGSELDAEEAVWRMTEVLSYLRHLRTRGEVKRERVADGTFRYAN